MTLQGNLDTNLNSVILDVKESSPKPTPILEFVKKM